MEKLKQYLFASSLFIFDSFISLAILIVFYIILTGGGEFYIGGKYISYYSSRNLLNVLFILLPLRFYLGRHDPFLNFKRLKLWKLPIIIYDHCVYLVKRLELLKKKEVIRLLIFIVLVSTVIKILNAWYYYGFFSGEDVEIIEMSLSHIYNWDWQAWNLGNPLYPMVFIMPVHYVLKCLGIHSPGILVFSGRLVVIIFSVLNILFIFRIVSRLMKLHAPGIFAAFFFAFSQLHITFSSSVLPETVASTFILLAFYLLIYKSDCNLNAFFAGIALGIGSVLCFSETIFFVPFLVYMIIEKRIRHAVWMSLTFLTTALILLGISDYLYWGSPLYSIKTIIDFNWVEMFSAKEYQSPTYYIAPLGEWTNWFMVFFAIIAWRKKKYTLLILVIIPLVLLSLFPHKESQFLVPVIPFLIIMAGIGIWKELKEVMQSSNLTIIDRKLIALILAFAFIGSLLFEMDGFRFRRSEAGVDIATYLDKQKNLQSVAIEQVWRTGGKIYLHKIPKVINLSTEALSDPNYLTKMINTPGLQIVALQDRNVERYHYDRLLMENGFQEIKVKQRGKNKYRLFKRHVARASYSRSVRCSSLEPSSQKLFFCMLP